MRERVHDPDPTEGAKGYPPAPPSPLIALLSNREPDIHPGGQTAIEGTENNERNESENDETSALNEREREKNERSRYNERGNSDTDDRTRKEGRACVQPSTKELGCQAGPGTILTGKTLEAGDLANARTDGRLDHS